MDDLAFGVRKKYSECDCGAKLKFSTDLPMFLSNNKLSIRCLNCKMVFNLRINPPGFPNQIDILDSSYYGKIYWQDAEDNIYTKNEEDETFTQI